MTPRHRAATRRSTCGSSRAAPPSTPTGTSAIGGCDVDALAPDLRHTALRVRRERAPGARARVPRGVRCRRGLVRGQGVPVPGDGPRSSRRRVSTSTSPPAASCTWRCTPGFPAERIVFHGNNKSDAELRAALELGVGRIVADSFDELDRLEALVGRRRHRRHACWCGSRPASRRTPTSTSPPAPTTRSSASPSPTARRAKRRCGWRSPTPSTSPASTATSARRSSCSSRSPSPRRSSSNLAAEVARDAPTAVDEINLGGGLGIPYTADDLDAPSIAEFAGVVRGGLRDRLSRRRARSRADAHGRGRPLDRGAVGDHALHASARSRTSPACAPTSRSTAA